MNRFPHKIIAVGLALAAGASCDPRRFDDLENDAWVQFAEKGDVQGDFGYDIAVVPRASGQKGLTLIVSAQTTAGLSQITYDGTGSITDQKGFNATSQGGGNLRPLVLTGKFTAALSAWLGPNSVPSFVVGQADTNIVAKFTMGLENGGTPLDPGTSVPGDRKTNYGVASAAGDLGTAAAGSPDIVVTGDTTLTLFPGNGGNPKSCGLKRPNTNNTVSVPLQNLVIRPDKKLIATSRVFRPTSDEPRIVLIDPAFANDVNSDCQATGSIVTGQAPSDTNARGDQPPVALALGNVDGSGGANDLVAGINVRSDSGKNGSVRIYKNVAFTDNAPFEEIDTTGDGITPLYGAQVALADIDGDGVDEIIVGDPTTSVNNVNQAGKVFIYKYGACPASGGTKKGPVCLIQTLYDPSPSTNDEFGRRIVWSTFPGDADTKKIVLVVSEKNKLWTYFRTLPSGTDVRK